MTSSQSNMWWQGRRVDDLYTEAPPLAALAIDSICDMERVAELLLHGGPLIFASADPHIDVPSRRLGSITRIAMMARLSEPAVATMASTLAWMSSCYAVSAAALSPRAPSISQTVTGHCALNRGSYVIGEEYERSSLRLSRRIRCCTRNLGRGSRLAL